MVDGSAPARPPRRACRPYSAAEPCSSEQLEGVAATLAGAFDAAPEVTRAVRPGPTLRQDYVFTDVLKLRGLRDHRPTTLAYRARSRPGDATRFGTVVTVAVDGGPLTLHLFEGLAAGGPKLPSPIPSHLLQGSPRALALAIVDADAAAATGACHVLELRFDDGVLTMQVPGWVHDAQDARTVLELASELAARIPAAMQELARSRAAAAGHGDAVRALAELRPLWADEAAAQKREIERAARRWALVGLVVIVVLVGGGLALVFALR